MAASSGAKRGDEDRADAAGEERADAADRERRAGAALARHLVPSMHVTTDDASPGMLTRIDVVEPPYWAP